MKSKQDTELDLMRILSKLTCISMIVFLVVQGTVHKQVNERKNCFRTHLTSYVDAIVITLAMNV